MAGRTNLLTTTAEVAEAGRPVPVGSVRVAVAAGEVVAEASPVVAEALAEAAAAVAGNVKNESCLFWILFTILSSVLLTGSYTRFEYDNLDIQFHDTYFVFDPAVIFALQVVATTLPQLRFHRHVF